MKLSYIYLFIISFCFTIYSCTNADKNQEESPDNTVNASEINPVNIKEWPVPWENTGTRDPYVDAEGRTWFCGQAGNYIAYLDSESGDFKQYDIEEGTHPHNLIVDSEGFVWYAGNKNAHIGRINPDDGSITKFEMPDTNAHDPHTLVFDRDENIWFTVQFGNFMGYLDTKSGEVTLIPAKEEKSRPYGIKMDDDGRPWVVLFGTNKLATIDPNSFELTEIELPDPESRPRRLEIGTDGIIYYADYSRGYLGSYNPQTAEFVEWALPGGAESRPYGTAMDSEGRIWVDESGVQPNRLVGFDPETEEFFSVTVIPSGGRTIRHMYYLASADEIWFGTDTNNIGRAKLPS